MYMLAVLEYDVGTGRQQITPNDTTDAGVTTAPRAYVSRVLRCQTAGGQRHHQVLGFDHAGGNVEVIVLQQLEQLLTSQTHRHHVGALP